MFDLRQTADDLVTFSAIFKDFAESIPDSAWDLRTGSRAKDWTLHEVFAHLYSIAHLYWNAQEVARAGVSWSMDGVTQRSDLDAWNQAQIAKLVQEKSPQQLIAAFLHKLDVCVMMVDEVIEAEAQDETMFLPIYNRPATVHDLLDFQLSHAGVIHAAQVTYPLEQPPLWERYSYGFTQRQVDRYLRQFTYAYWGEFGPQTPTTINFHFDDGTGEWHLVAAPDGGYAKFGAIENADHELRFASPQVMFRVFNIASAFQEELLAGQIIIKGDWQATMELIKLYSAAPPKR